MQQFQAIATAIPGADGHPSRNSGEPGYKASVDYVARLMKQAGYIQRLRAGRSRSSSAARATVGAKVLNAQAAGGGRFAVK